MAQPPSRRVLHRASQVPVALIDEVITDMAARMDGSPEARRCAGLSFTYRITDRRVASARYQVGARGAISLTRDDGAASSFVFSGDTDIFDSVLLGVGAGGALSAIVGGRIRMRGSLLRIRGILRMMPAVHRAYAAARVEMMRRHAARYDFRF